MSNKIYRIRRKSDGLYSTGGQYIYWTKKGKTWNSIGAVSSHIAGTYNECILRRNGKIAGVNMSLIPADHPYHDAEIVEAEIVFEAKKNVHDYVNDRFNMGMKPDKALE